MKWTTNQIIYFTYSVVSFVFLALCSSGASFLPNLESWTLIGVFAVIFVVLPLFFLFRRKDLFYEIAIKNKGLLYSQAVCLFILEFILYINQKDEFLNSPHSMELFTWMLTLALFLSIIRVIRPLTFEEWSNK
tara:strand:+ start:383 stop:781 length:399 start_codon:yes stop_codon:yes gene_type:complete